MSRKTKEEIQGKEYFNIRFSRRQKKATRFVAGLKKKHRSGDLVYMSGEVKLADGTEYWAILGFDEESSGEHFDTMIFAPQEDGTCALAIQCEKGFNKLLGKTSKQIVPYKYRYFGTLNCDDIHVRDNGWSR